MFLEVSFHSVARYKNISKKIIYSCFPLEIGDKIPFVLKARFIEFLIFCER
jgi:hypothetical protein